MCICNKWPQEGSKRRSRGHVSAAHSTPLLGQQQPSPPAVPGSTDIGPGPHSWRHKATLLQRVFNHSKPRWWVYTELPVKLCFCETAASDSFCYSHNYSFDWWIDKKGFTLTVLSLKVCGHSSSVHTFITECRVIVRRERRRVRVHTRCYPNTRGNLTIKKRFLP